MDDKINLAAALQSFDTLWDPHTIGKLNDYDLKVAHIEGDFTWHSHTDTDELFLVVAGFVQLHLRDRTINLGAGDVYVVPRGVEHKPESVDGADILLIEPSGTTNTGDVHEEIPDHIETTTGKVVS